MRLPEIRRAIFDDLRDRTGLTFDESPNTFIGEFVAVFAEREAALWELAEAVWLAVYPATATGASLDLAASFSGVQRQQRRRSTARAVFYGQPGTVVPPDFVVESTANAADGTRSPRWRTLVSTTISTASAAYLRLTGEHSNLWGLVRFR